MYPVEPPPVRVELALGRRRHRRLTAPSGLLLFLCVFLPLVRGCDDRTPIYPVELPMFLPPYIFGLAFAGAAMAVTARGLRRAIGVVRALAVVSLAASALIFAMRPLLGIAAVIASALMLAAIGWNGQSERRLAAGAVLLGVAGTLWFGLCSTSADALSGVYAALVASIGLLAGGLVWLVEATHAPPIVVPPAIARDRRSGLSSGG
ncbi:MAG: hypothetical protein ACM31C_27570 [Acidobacteriota bacterium]